MRRAQTARDTGGREGRKQRGSVERKCKHLNRSIKHLVIIRALFRRDRLGDGVPVGAVQVDVNPRDLTQQLPRVPGVLLRVLHLQLLAVRACTGTVESERQQTGLTFIFPPPSTTPSFGNDCYNIRYKNNNIYTLPVRRLGVRLNHLQVAR